MSGFNSLIMLARFHPSNLFSRNNPTTETAPATTSEPPPVSEAIPAEPTIDTPQPHPVDEAISAETTRDNSRHGFFARFARKRTTEGEATSTSQPQPIDETIPEEHTTDSPQSHSAGVTRPGEVIRQFSDPDRISEIPPETITHDPQARPISEAISTTDIDDAATDLNLDDDTSTTNRNSAFLPDFKEQPPPPSNSPVYEQLAQKNPSALDHLSITIGPPVIILFDIVVPIIIYYAWYNTQIKNYDRNCQAMTQIPKSDPAYSCPLPSPEYDEEILGYAIISFGFGEVYILIARVVRLLRHRDLCAPLLSRSKWELDATSWVYGVAMIMALIPFVVGSALEIPQLYLYSPGFLMAFLAILMLITLIPVPLPIGINSHARGAPLRPFTYYAAEDFIAVDGLQDREFRVRYNQRYEDCPMFRRMFTYLTLWWILGVCVYLGALSALIWTVEFHYAFGATLGVLFAYIVIWAIVSYLWVGIEMEREKKWYAKQRGEVPV